MNPIVFNCVLLYVFVIVLSLFQSRFNILKEDKLVFVLVVVLGPFVVFAKTKGRLSWPGLTAMDIFFYTLMLAYLNAKTLIPRINEGLIYAYTLLHWYLLSDAYLKVGANFWNIAVFILSVYPTVLIIKSAFEHKRLVRHEKITLYYWFLFTVGYCFVSQFALHIISPILTYGEISLISALLIAFSAVQLYFISSIFSLIFIAIPLFHLDKGSEPFSVRWKRAMKSWRKILGYKLDNYIEYQINGIQVLYITVFSCFLFYIDASSIRARPYTVIIYTIVLPIIYFYMKSMPEENLNEEQPLNKIRRNKRKMEQIH